MRVIVAALVLLTLLVLPFPTAMSRFDVAGTIPQRATVLGYSRAEFGEGWETLDDGCTTRTAAMAAAFAADSCRRPHREWSVAPVTDPYTGDPLAPANVEVDHLVPLSAAWDLGAHTWTPEQRRAFANDPRNLVVTSSAANQAKSDHLPSEWLPPDRRARCAYARRLAGVAAQYNLPLPRADVRAARRACSGVAGLISRRELVTGPAETPAPRELKPGAGASVP